MNIWLVNIFDEFPSPGEYPGRMVSLAQVLIDQGHKVTWWSSDWSHRYKRKRSYNKPDHPLQIICLPTLPYCCNTGPKRLWSHSKLARTLYQTAVKAVENGEMNAPDTVIVNLPPPSLGMSVAKLKERLGFQMILDIRDSWPENFVQLLPSRFHLRKILGPILLAPFRWNLGKLYRSADKISAVSRDYLATARRYGRDDGKVFYIGCPSDRLEQTPTPMKERPGSPFRLVYIGSMSRSYDLFTIIRGLALIPDPTVRLELAGLGDTEEDLKALSQKLGIADRITFHGMLDEKPLWELLNRCHLAINAVHPDSAIAMPNKIGDYCAAALPILQSRETGELAEMIREKEFGALYRSQDNISFAKCIQYYLAEKNKRTLMKQSRNSLNFAESNLDRKKIYSDFLNWGMLRKK